jgi:very-short-patch-repair endonuclease
MTTEVYLSKFPGSKLLSDDSRAKYSEGTRNYFKTLSQEDKDIRYSARVYSSEAKEKIKAALKSGRHKIDYNDTKRTERISNAKKEWWKKKTKEERSLFIKNIVIPNTIARIGYDAFARKCRAAGINGYNSIIGKGIAKECNGFESYMFSTIKERGYDFIAQFEIDGWFYDCFIPEKNLIIEFDGDYWHAKSKEDCINNRLKRQWKIDRSKDEIAINKGYQIVRIRESKKDELKSIL